MFKIHDILTYLPSEIVRRILSYKCKYFVRKTKLIPIFAIPKSRYDTLLNRPMIHPIFFGSEVVLYSTELKKITLTFMDYNSDKLCYKYAVHENDGFRFWDAVPSSGWTFRH